MLFSFQETPQLLTNFIPSEMFSLKITILLVVFCTWYACAFRVKNVCFKCSNGGTLTDGKCFCKEGFTGDCCQLQIGKYMLSRKRLC